MLLDKFVFGLKVKMDIPQKAHELFPSLCLPIKDTSTKLNMPLPLSIIPRPELMHFASFVNSKGKDTWKGHFKDKALDPFIFPEVDINTILN
ncbi:Uncharacterized protein TCM_026099 [Theobroma cacao]|uniref:Uncharacterized protein n=1 Tax=Theobroma cacao TaxID=3641 RepID=A0A061F1L0_THECC|nr:Uncharacterized protein TCM_026099 [Theobroma cacao]